MDTHLQHRTSSCLGELQPTRIHFKSLGIRLRHGSRRPSCIVGTEAGRKQHSCGSICCAASESPGEMLPDRWSQKVETSRKPAEYKEDVIFSERADDRRFAGLHATRRHLLVSSGILTAAGLHGGPAKAASTEPAMELVRHMVAGLEDSTFILNCRGVQTVCCMHAHR